MEELPTRMEACHPHDEGLRRWYPFSLELEDVQEVVAGCLIVGNQMSMESSESLFFLAGADQSHPNLAWAYPWFGGGNYHAKMNSAIIPSWLAVSV